MQGIGARPWMSMNTWAQEQKNGGTRIHGGSSATKLSAGEDDGVHSHGKRVQT